MIQTHQIEQHMLPDQDDDRGGLGHGSNEAADTYYTQEDEEHLLATWNWTFPGNSSGRTIFRRYTAAASQVL